MPDTKGIQGVLLPKLQNATVISQLDKHWVSLDGNRLKVNVNEAFYEHKCVVSAGIII